MNLNSIKDICEILFLMGVREWILASSIPGLGAVNFQLFLNYLLKFPTLFINRERNGLDYPYGNFLYGETPYYTAREIVEIAGITKEDVVYDLGCGPGKFIFFVHAFTGARCIGADLIPTYIRIAQKIVEKLGLSRIDFFREDILDMDLSTATVVFVNGTYFSRETHKTLSRNINRMNKGTRFISSSVSYDNPRLELTATKNLLFSWSRTPVYFYVVK